MMSRSRQDKPRHLARRQFGSDNYAGICHEAWEALATANTGHAVAYGDDPYTERAVELIRDWFEVDCEVFFTFNGTAANALALASACQSYHAVICHEYSHVQTDECGAPEFFTGGIKLLPIAGNDGKLSASGIEARIKLRTDVHFSKTRAISLTHATEVGTVYSVDEIRSLTELARRYGLTVHMDGARFANALVSQGLTASAATWRAGVEMLSLGGTKIGLPVGDVVVFFNKTLAEGFEHRRKQAAQLCSKMRFLSAPWVGMLENDAFLRHARQANTMAQRLRSGLEQIGGIQLPFPTEANSVFVDMPATLRESLYARGWKFYALIGDNICRLMCAWDTRAEDVDAFVADVREILT
jgi:threonine aldolase